MGVVRCIWILYFVGISAELCHAQYDLFRLHKRDDGTKAKFCGRILANQLSYVCNGRYNTKWSNEKKSTTDIMGIGIEGAGADAKDYWEWSDGLDEAENILGSGLPWLPRHGTSVLRTGPRRTSYRPPRRRRRGIVEECCYTACSINELREYCYG